MTLGGSQTHVVKQHLPLSTQEANVVVNVLLADMMDTFDQFLGQSDDDELLVIGGLQKGVEYKYIIYVAFYLLQISRSLAMLVDFTCVGVQRWIVMKQFIDDLKRKWN